MADDERHDPRCPVMPCTCADIARRVREADARRACQIRGPSTPGFVQSLPSLPSLTGPAGVPVDLPAAEQAEVDRRSAELRRHRAEALVSGQRYIVGGPDG